MLKKVLVLGLSIGLATSLMAKPNVEKPENFKARLAKAAGEPGMFLRGKEVFPKDYFLVSKNLPYLVGLSLHHPQSSTLNLNDKQIEEIQKIKKSTVPVVLKAAKEIKNLELELAKNIAIDDKEPKSQYELVDKIAKLKADLTKAHLQCISDVKKVLTKEQFEKLLKYATYKGAKK